MNGQEMVVNNATCSNFYGIIFPNAHFILCSEKNHNILTFFQLIPLDEKTPKF